MLSGDNSILQKATTAKENTDSAQIKERIQLAYHSALVGGQGSYTYDTLMKELENEFKTDYDVDDSGKDNWILYAHGQNVTIPAGKIDEEVIDLSVNTTWQQAFEFPQYNNYTSYLLDNEEKTLTIRRGPPITSENVEIKSYAVIDGVKYTTKFPDSCSNLFATSQFKAMTIDSAIDTSNVTDMTNMFISCRNLESLNISGFNTANVTSMERLFCQCYKLKELDLSNFDTSNVVNMNSMFSNSLNSGDTDIVPNLKKIIVSNKFVTTKVTESSNMFKRCTNLIGGNGTVYNENIIDVSMAHIDGGTSNPGYFSAKTN